MDEHLTRDLFRAIHKGWRNPGDLAAIAMAHLFELCPRCRKEFESWRAELGEGVAAPEGQDFDAVFDRLRAPAAANDGDTTALEARVDAERKQARSRAEQLLALPVEQRIDWIRNERDKHSGVLLAEVLIEECRKRTPDFPYEGKVLALLARVVLQHATASGYAVELYALALARLANAIRVIGDLPRADQILADARYLLHSQGGGDRLARAEVDSLEASLRNSQARATEAIPLLLRALMAYRLECGETEKEAACLMKLGRAHLKRLEFQRGLEIYREISRLLEGGRQVRLRRMNLASIGTLLMCAGRYAESWDVLEEAGPLYSDAAAPLESLRWAWTRANTLYGLGRCEDGEAALVSIRRSFAAQHLLYDQSVASLALAMWYADQRRYCEARPLVEEALATFQTLQVFPRTEVARVLRATIAA